MTHTFSRSAEIQLEGNDRVIVAIGGPDASASVTNPTANPAGVVTITISGEDGSIRDHFVPDRDFGLTPSLKLSGEFAGLWIENHLPADKFLGIEIESFASDAQIALVGNFAAVKADIQGPGSRIVFDGITQLAEVRLAPDSDLRVSPSGDIARLAYQDYVADSDGSLRLVGATSVSVAAGRDLDQVRTLMDSLNT